MEELVTRLATLLLARRLRLVTAESCTGGLLAAHLTDLAGSSEWFDGSFVTYTPDAKTRMLGVDPSDLERWSAVSEPVARQMATGALEKLHADIAVAITGIAGPGGGEPMTPVGTVWFAWAMAGPSETLVQTSEHLLLGDRESVREQAVEIALQGLLSLLE